ncbi:MAG TPA: hypothetical protein VM425_08450 [Myxococcota bacterium]|nr:hypothetical protein [Myxococcota bacterium]
MRTGFIKLLAVGLPLVIVSLGSVTGCSESEAQGDAQVDSDADNNGDQVSTDGDQGTASDADQAASDEVIDDGEKCGPDGDCIQGAYCCKGYCANLDYDPLNCGKCGIVCPSDTPYCSGGKCGKLPCMIKCDDGETCCGSQCCAGDQVCCTVIRGGPLAAPDCYGLHCPAGCPLCK